MKKDENKIETEKQPNTVPCSFALPCSTDSSNNKPTKHHCDGCPLQNDFLHHVYIQGVPTCDYCVRP